jgi:hypothetical protein
VNLAALYILDLQKFEQKLKSLNVLFFNFFKKKNNNLIITLCCSVHIASSRCAQARAAHSL